MEAIERTIIPLCSGVHATLEAEADRLIFADRHTSAGTHESKSYIFSPNQWYDRYHREVYVAHQPEDWGDSASDADAIPFGPDASTRRGFFGRAANRGMLHLNSTYKTASVLPRWRGVTMWDLRTDCGKTFPVKVSHL